MAKKSELTVQSLKINASCEKKLLSQNTYSQNDMLDSWQSEAVQILLFVKIRHSKSLFWERNLCQETSSKFTFFFSFFMAKFSLHLYFPTPTTVYNIAEINKRCIRWHEEYTRNSGLPNCSFPPKLHFPPDQCLYMYSKESHKLLDGSSLQQHESL